MVSGSDDQSVLVWDKQTTQLLEELKGHDGQVCVLNTSSLINDWLWNQKGVCRGYKWKNNQCNVTVIELYLV